MYVVCIHEFYEHHKTMQVIPVSTLARQNKLSAFHQVRVSSVTFKGPPATCFNLPVNLIFSSTLTNLGPGTCKFNK